MRAWSSAGGLVDRSRCNAWGSGVWERAPGGGAVGGGADGEETEERSCGEMDTECGSR